MEEELTRSGGGRAGHEAKNGMVKVKGTYWAVNVKLVQCAGLVVTPKLSTTSAYRCVACKAVSRLYLRKATKNVATGA